MSAVGVNLLNQETMSLFRRVLVIGNGLCGETASKALSEIGLSCVYAKVSKLCGVMYECGTQSESVSNFCASDDVDPRFITLIFDELPSVERDGPFFKIECAGLTDNLFGSIVFAFGASFANEGRKMLKGLTGDKEANFSRGRERIGFILDSLPLFDPEEGMSAVAAAMEHQRSGGTSYVFFENMPVAFHGAELLCDQAKKLGVDFIRYEKGREPTVKLLDDHPEGGPFLVSVMDSTVGQSIDVRCDRVYGVGDYGPVSIPDSIKAIANHDLDRNGFILSESIHCGLGQSFTRGVFAIGGCTGTLGTSQMIAQAYTVAAKVRARALAASRMASVERISVNDECIRCLTCFRICPHSAIAVNYAAARSKISSFSVSCEDCGLCISECPREALDLKAFPQMGIEGFLHDIRSNSRGMFVVYGCERSTSDSVSKIDMPDGALFLAVPCAGRVSESMIWATLNSGVSGVLVVGCHDGNCASRNGTNWAGARVREVLRKLRETGIVAPPVSYATVSARQTKKLETLVQNFKMSIDEQGKDLFARNEMGK